MTATGIGFVDWETYLNVRTEGDDRDQADLIISGEGFREIIGEFQNRMGVTHCIPRS